MRELVIDLYCGLGGWAEGFLAEGYRVIGYDIEAHDYGTGGYPGELILRDVRSISGSECKDAVVIVASPPCQAYSYRAMPWKRAKALPPPDNTLFNECFRIQREASEAAGRYIPLIVENVRGAQKWVGRAKANFGSFYLWGDVGMVGRRVVAIVEGKVSYGVSVAPMKAEKFNPDGTEHGPGSCDAWWDDALNERRKEATALKTAKDGKGGYGGNFGWDDTPLRRGKLQVQLPQGCFRPDRKNPLRSGAAHRPLLQISTCEEARMNSLDLLSDAPLPPGDPREWKLFARLLLRYLADHVRVAQVGEDQHYLQDITDFSDWLRELAEFSQPRYRDHTCPDCAHEHTGREECGHYLGEGKFCHCESKVTA